MESRLRFAANYFLPMVRKITQQRPHEMKERYGLESIQTVKDAHSPDGQAFYALPSFADLPDCPVCKYGTPLEKNNKLVCIDCGATVGTIDKEMK